MLYIQDPVCGELIAWEDAKAIIRFDGQLYYFCCLSCRKRFVANPADWLSREMSEEVSSQPEALKPARSGGC